MNAHSERLELRGSQRLLLELIRRHAPVTRAELARLSGLTAGAITQQCRELMFSGLVVEGERKSRMQSWDQFLCSGANPSHGPILRAEV